MQWSIDLPPCPCELAVDENGSVTLHGALEKNWSAPSKSSWLQRYHPGADYEIRSLTPNQYGAGQQCTYKKQATASGKPVARLITTGVAAGTPDRVSPSRSGATYEHYQKDVRPWDDSVLLDGGTPGRHVETIYLVARPPNNANNCASLTVSTVIQDTRQRMDVSVSPMLGSLPVQRLLGGPQGAAAASVPNIAPGANVEIGARLVPTLALRGSLTFQGALSRGTWLRGSPETKTSVFSSQIGGLLVLYPLAFMYTSEAPFRIEPNLGFGIGAASVDVDDGKEPLSVAATNRTYIPVRTGIDVTILPYLSLAFALQYTYWLSGTYVVQTNATANSPVTHTGSDAHSAAGFIGLRLSFLP